MIHTTKTSTGRKGMERHTYTRDDSVHVCVYIYKYASAVHAPRCVGDGASGERRERPHGRRRCCSSGNDYFGRDQDERRMKRRRESARAAHRSRLIPASPIQGQPATGSSAVVLTSSPLAFLPLLVPLLRQQKRHSALSVLSLSLSLSLSLCLSARFLLICFAFSVPPLRLASYTASHQPFYAAHQSFLLAFLFSLLADPPSTHARTHVCHPIMQPSYSSMTRPV